MRLQHWLLLLLRAAAIALLAFALARPTVKWGGAVGSQEKQVAAALVFDAAPHMEYRHENRTRLEVAREMGQWLVSQLPEGSPIAVLDTRPGSTAALHPEPGVAKERIGRLESVSNSQPLTVRGRSGRQAAGQERAPQGNLRASPIFRARWPAEQAAALRQQLAALPDCGLYIIDVGTANPANFSLGEIRLTDNVLSARSTLRLATDRLVPGNAGGPHRRTVRFRRPRPAAKTRRANVASRPRARRSGSSFASAGSSRAYTRDRCGSIGQDGLAADDVRYFTVKVKPAWHILLAAPQPAETRALFLDRRCATGGLPPPRPSLVRLRRLRFPRAGRAAAGGLRRRLPAGPAAAGSAAVENAHRLRGRRAWRGDLPGPQRHADRIVQRTAGATVARRQIAPPVAAARRRRLARAEGFSAPRSWPSSAGLAGSVPWEAFPVLRYWELDAAGRRSSQRAVRSHYNDGSPGRYVRGAAGRARAAP